MDSNDAVIATRPKNGDSVRGDYATRWKPGQSGNPGGRPKRMPLTDVTREKLPQKIPDDPQGRTYAEAIVDKLIAMAIGGDIAAIRELHDRAEGKARQTIDLGSAALRDAYERLTPEESQAWLRDGKAPAWWTRGEPMSDEANS
jgi:hypothetical protein